MLTVPASHTGRSAEPVKQMDDTQNCCSFMPKPDVLAYPIFPFWRGYVDGDRRTEAGRQPVTTYLLI
uniref:hypothetical protein n=1 Tax=Pseudomonadota TaxID=1224 RepID=UPI001595A13A|nr:MULTISPECIES: hypothetical protein [Pseudomonadota]